MTDTAIELETVIGPNTLIKGEVTFMGPARILGRIEGHVRASNLVEIGEGASVLGDVSAAVVDVHGTVNGNVRASECVRIGPTARLNGELRAANLAIAEGATFVGKVWVGVDVELPTADATGAADAHEGAAGARGELPEAPGDAKVSHGEPASTPQPVIRVITQSLQQAAQAAANRQPRIIKAR